MRTGDKAVLVNASGLTEDALKEGVEGMVNSVIHMEGESFSFFMPEGGREQYVIHSDRLEVIGEYTGSDLPKVN